jgi:amino-acid N-acetyltransferase
MSATIRQARMEDVPQLLAMINEFAAQNLMLPRTEEKIVQSLPDWLVAEAPVGEGGELAVVGSGALIPLTDEMAEVRSLAVHPSQHGQGLGSRIVETLVALARVRGYRQVCALTLRESFFERLGFHIVDRWSISPKLWQECIYCPKFHRCDEVAVLMNLTDEPIETILANTAQPAAWNSLLKHPSWQPLKLAYNRKPIHLER